jgi:hypothetical protein
VNVSARFERGTRLTVNVVGDVIGGAFVSFTPSAGYACNGAPGSMCSFTYAPGDTVKLKTATTSDNYHRAPGFISWGGVSGCGTGDECNITFGNTDVVVTATFTRNVQLLHTGVGRGTVVSAPAGINCASGTLCSAVKLTPGQPLTLTATPDAGSLIGSWVAGVANITDQAAVRACGGASQCTFTPTGYVQVNIQWKIEQ